MKNMDTPFRIEKRNAFRVVGYGIQTTTKKGAGRKAIPAYWLNFKKEGKENLIIPLANKKPYGLLGINIYNIDETNPRIFEYLIAVSSDVEVDDKLTVYEVPAMTWAVFPCAIDTIGKTESQAIMKWLPKYKYKPLNKGYITGKMKSKAPDIEYYGENGLAEVWIAVVEK